MRLVRLALLMVVLLAVGCGQSGSRDSEVTRALEDYLRKHGRTPEDYIVAKFEDHDIVFLGEWHRIKHDVELIHRLIPRLAKARVLHLGMEFAVHEDQKAIDALVTGDSYDEDTARGFMWNQWPFWGYQEYVDIFRAAWEINQKLAPSGLVFRVIGLNAKSDWSHIWSPEDRENPEKMRLVWPHGDADEYMARVIISEFVNKGQKALIYSGINHAYTGYHQPVYDDESGTVVRLNDRRMGNRVFEKIGKKAITIFMHSPWPSAQGYSAGYVRPVDGIIDEVMAHLGDEIGSVGFDVDGTPFARLPGETGLWKHGYENFTLSRYCDGYIYQRPLVEYEGVTPIEGWFTEENRLEAVSQIANPNPRVKHLDRTVTSLFDSMARDADIPERFRRMGMK